MMDLQVVILAAGRGQRMHSKRPKVLHSLGGKPLLQYVIRTACSLNENRSPIIVYGHQGNMICETFSHYPIRFVEQKEQCGTGHALLQALPHIKDDDRVLVLSGDVPLITEETLRALLDKTPKHAIGLLTASLTNPLGYGRIKRNAQHDIVGIVEEKDANNDERMITEINPGIYLVPTSYLKKWLPKLNQQNAQSEYYLTDMISFAVEEKIAIYSMAPTCCEEVLGINDRVQLNQLERFYQKQQAEKLMQAGVTLYDPNRFDVRGDVDIGRDVSIDVNVILEGHVIIGDDCVIGANTLLRNVKLGSNVEIKPNSIIDGAEIADHAVIGPFARLRPGTIVAAHAHVGNFVELKNSMVGEHTKINHLSYIGDSEVGQRVNIGAGTITCNYDGMNKHKTVIEDDVHIGSDTQIVAPLTIGQGATIGAGSTIIKDVPPHQLTLSHTLNQRSEKNWQRPDKQKQKVFVEDEN